MGDKRFNIKSDREIDMDLDMELEEMIRATVKTEDVPTTELNQKLKAALYQKEAVLHKHPAMRRISLWYLPMILNLVTFSLLAVLALLVIENRHLSYLAVGSCLYFGVAGILLTVVGVKRANIKDMAICIEKRGALI